VAIMVHARRQPSVCLVTNLVRRVLAGLAERLSGIVSRPARFPTSATSDFNSVSRRTYSIPMSPESALLLAKGQVAEG
jgi:hypothetical protein